MRSVLIVQVPVNIHTPVQNSDYIKVVVRVSKKDNMHACFVFPVPLSDIGSLPDPAPGGQAGDGRHDAAMIFVSLFQRPLPGRIQPNFFQIGLGQR